MNKTKTSIEVLAMLQDELRLSDTRFYGLVEFAEMAEITEVAVSELIEVGIVSTIGERDGECIIDANKLREDLSRYFVLAGEAAGC